MRRRSRQEQHGSRGCRTSDERGRVRMVDVGDKAVTAREAVARGRIAMSREARPADPRRAR